MGRNVFHSVFFTLLIPQFFLRRFEEIRKENQTYSMFLIIPTYQGMQFSSKVSQENPSSGASRLPGQLPDGASQEQASPVGEPHIVFSLYQPCTLCLFFGEQRSRILCLSGRNLSARLLVHYSRDLYWIQAASFHWTSALKKNVVWSWMTTHVAKLMTKVASHKITFT